MIYQLRVQTKEGSRINHYASELSRQAAIGELVLNPALNVLVETEQYINDRAEMCDRPVAAVTKLPRRNYGKEPGRIIEVPFAAVIMPKKKPGRKARKA